MFGVVGTTQAAGDAAAGKAKAGCMRRLPWRERAREAAPNPALAGKSEDSIVQALQDYKSGKRSNAIMKSVREQLERPGHGESGGVFRVAEGK